MQGFGGVQHLVHHGGNTAVESGLLELVGPQDIHQGGPILIGDFLADITILQHSANGLVLITLRSGITIAVVADTYPGIEEVHWPPSGSRVW